MKNNPYHLPEDRKKASIYLCAFIGFIGAIGIFALMWVAKIFEITFN